MSKMRGRTIQGRWDGYAGNARVEPIGDTGAAIELTAWGDFTPTQARKVAKALTDAADAVEAGR